MKKIIYLSMAALVWLHTPVRAANDSATFIVTINLTSKCVIGTVAAVVFNYESFQPADTTAAGGDFNIKCTNTLPYRIGFTNTSLPATTETVTDNVVGLEYDLGLSATEGVGTGSDQPYAVRGTMRLGQAGTCLLSVCTANNTRTLYVVY